MTLSFREPFRRAVRSLQARDQAAVLRVLLELEAALAQPHEHGGLGLRKLHPTEVWDARAGLDLRVLFLLARDHAILMFAGAHDEVQRFLKSL